MCDFNNGSTLYDFGKTKESLSKSKFIEKSYNTTDKVGYGFYRFIAVKKDKLVIASDGAAWITDQSTIANCNKVFVYDLENWKLNAENASVCKLSKELEIVDFSLQWK